MSSKLAERHYERAVNQLQRGRADLADKNFRRALEGGVNVFQRLRTEDFNKARVGKTKLAEDTDAAKALFQKLVDAKPSGFERAKGWKPTAPEVPDLPQRRAQVEVIGERPAPDFLESASGGGGSGETSVVDVTWDSGAGALIIHYADETTSSIPFSECPA